MDKANVLIIAFCVLIFIAYFVRRYSLQTPPPTTTTTSKTVVVKQSPNYVKRYGYVPPPPQYNPYKAQYY
jgi:hypothetical protein